MSHVNVITTVLRVPPGNFRALVQGRTVIAIPQAFLRVGQQFALCSPTSIQDSNETEIAVWAKCEDCKALGNSYTLDELSQISSWSISALKQLIEEKKNLFIAELRVYQLATAIKVSLKFNGQFASLPDPISATEALPVLENEVFEQRRKSPLRQNSSLGESRKDPDSLHTSDLKTQPSAKSIESFLKDLDAQTNIAIGLDPDLSWVKNINKLGIRSKQSDTGKSHYQAGTDFENIVHKALDFLGFTIDQSHKGGAGGLDLFCSSPFPLVGECKAGKSIPSGTVEELVKLGGAHLNPDQFLASSKLIIGPGSPTSYVLTAAVQWRVSIINPMSLQKLVELKVQYPGSINLVELQEYLKPGCIDSKIDEYIQSVLSQIRLRSHIVQSVKELTKPNEKQLQVVAIQTCYNIKFSNGHPLSEQAVHELLIELSSPLVGYLGRLTGLGITSDRFYYLRDLPEPKIN